MYRGDGSFRTNEITQEESLIDLLHLEKEYVVKYNDRAIAIDIARKNALNVTDLYEELGRINEKLTEVRQKIANYMHTNFNTKTTLGDILYSNNESGVVRLDRKPVGYDKDRNPVYKD